MSIVNYIKRMGLIKIAEVCNWDLMDIRLHLIRNARVKDSKLSNSLKWFEALFEEKAEIYKKDPLLLEVIEKLKGE